MSFFFKKNDLKPVYLYFPLSAALEKEIAKQKDLEAQLQQFQAIKDSEMAYVKSQLAALQEQRAQDEAAMRKSLDDAGSQRAEIAALKMAVTKTEVREPCTHFAERDLILILCQEEKTELMNRCMAGEKTIMKLQARCVDVDKRLNDAQLAAQV